MFKPSTLRNPASAFPPSSRRRVSRVARPRANARGRPGFARWSTLLVAMTAVVSGCNNNAAVTYNRYATLDGNPPALESADAALQWCEDRIYDLDERLELWLY